MRWAGWERSVNRQTFLPADVNALSQDTLNMMFRTKIWTPRNNVRADMFGRGWSPSRWHKGQNHNSWARNSSNQVQGEPHKEERRTKVPLLPSYGSNTGPVTGSWAHWPQGHIPDILPPAGDLLVSLQRTDVLSTTCVAQGCQRRSRRAFVNTELFHFQTCCGLISGESHLYRFLWLSYIYWDSLPEIYLDSY